MNTMTSARKRAAPQAPIVKQCRVKLCLYFIGTNYTPFTANHAHIIGGMSSTQTATRMIQRMLNDGWARNVASPVDAPRRDRNRPWFELTPLGIHCIMGSAVAKGVIRPQPGSQLPIFRRRLRGAKPPMGPNLGLQVKPVDTTTLSVARNSQEPSPQLPPLAQEREPAPVEEQPAAPAKAPETIIMVSLDGRTLQIPLKRARDLYNALAPVFGKGSDA